MTTRPTKRLFQRPGRRVCARGGAASAARGATPQEVRQAGRAEFVHAPADRVRQAEMAQTRAKVRAQWAAIDTDLRAARAELMRLRQLNAAEAARLDPSLPVQ